MAAGAPGRAMPSGSSAPTSPGDPASRIDWRQSAKSDRLFVRETEWEAAQTVALWRDDGAGMDWRSSHGSAGQARCGRSCCCWRWPRCCCAAASGCALFGLPRALRRARHALPAIAGALGQMAPRPEDRRARAPCARGAVRRFPGAAGADARARRARWPRRASGATCCRCSTPRRRPCPSPAASASRASAARRHALVPRVEAVRELYAERLARHRDGAGGAGARRRLDLRHAPHRPAARSRRCWRCIADLAPG